MSDHSLRTYDSILELLPSAENPTPIVRLQRVTGFEHAQVYVKLEWYNPFGAVKDQEQARCRPSKAMRVLVAAIELDPKLMERAAKIARERWPE